MNIGYDPWDACMTPTDDDPDWMLDLSSELAEEIPAPH